MKAANRATITVARSCFYWGLTQQPLELYNKYAEAQIKEALGGHHDWSVFANEHTPAGLTCGMLTGTKVLLKACAELRSLDSCA